MKKLLVVCFMVGLAFPTIAQSLYKMKKMNRVLVDNPFVIDSMAMVRNSKSGIEIINSSEIMSGSEFSFWIRLKSTNSRALDLLKSSEFRPIQLKWLRINNYGYVPERNDNEKIEVLGSTNIEPYEKSQNEKKYFTFELLYTSILKRPGLYLIHPVFNDNQPVTKNGKEGEFKFEIK